MHPSAQLSSLKIYNSLTGKKEHFEPLNPPHVGIYVCGPTVYSNVHLGNCRTFTSFDIVRRYLTQLGYKVRYVRNITDVGHLTDDMDQGEDKIAKRAKLENLEPMEIVQRYTKDFHTVMGALNNLPPSIEPTASGHIVEQIEMTRQLINEGLAYEADGSVYFDVQTYQSRGLGYGKLSGRKLEDMLSGSRQLEGQADKRNPADFALWKKASPGHIMRWPSPWGLGFPGWHLECSVMSAKYLGKTFDIHGGGLDLKFPHHECEIAQGTGAYQQSPANIWMHTNMLTLNGQKMSKSLGNSILPHELFSGKNQMFSRPYSPMTFRFFMLQAHYRSTMDLSDSAFAAAQKGYFKMMNGLKTAKKIRQSLQENTENYTDAPEEKQSAQIEKIIQDVYSAMNDDFNTAAAVAALFNLLKKINALETKQLAPAQVGKPLLEKMTQTYISFVEDVLGLEEEKRNHTDYLIGMVLQEYQSAKTQKNYQKVDEIREKFKQIGIQIKDMKDRTDWAYDEQS